MTYQDCADFFGVSKGRIGQVVSANKMKVNTALVRDNKLGKELVKKDFQAMDIVQGALMDAREIQSFVKRALDGDEVILKRLNELGVSDKFDAFRKSNNDLISNFEKYVKIQKTIFDVNQMMEFRDVVMKAIETCADRETKKKIINYIKEYKGNRDTLNYA